jgi:hypothetical protein
MRASCLAVLVALGGIASAHPILIARDPPISDWRSHPAVVEWSTWLGFGVGVAASPSAVSAARTTSPSPTTNLHSTWTFSAGAEATVPLSRRVRIGPWAGLHDLEPMIGGELQVVKSPANLDLFFYPGEGVWTVRAGGGVDHMTAALAWGYRCPWRLWGPYTHATRYEIGPRLTATFTRSYLDPHTWSATVGLEVEPVGALRYLLGIRAWY